MALTVTPYFPRLAAARSPNWLVLGAYGYRTAIPVIAQFRFSFAIASTVGDIIAFDTLDGYYLFTCSLSVDDSGYTFLAGSDPTDSATKFGATLLTCVAITTRYTVFVSGTDVTLTARVPDNRYSYQTSDIAPPGLATVIVTGIGAVATYAPNYSAVVRVYLQDSNATNGYALLPERSFTPDPKTLVVATDLQDQLVAKLKPDWPQAELPGFPVGGAIRNELSVKKWYAESWERFGAPAVNKASQLLGSISTPYLAWLAGWDEQESGSYTVFTNRILGLLGAPHLFLTQRNRVSRRFVTTSEQHYLGWYHWPMDYVGTILRMEARLTHTALNGTDPQTTNWSIRYSVGTDEDGVAPRGSISTWDVGYGQLDMAAVLPTGRVPQSYEVRIGSASGPKSERIRFWIAKPDHQELHIQYCSSLGIIENIRTTGAWKITGEHQYQEIEKAPVYSDQFNTEDGSRNSHPLGEQRMLEVFSGYNSPDEHKALLDMLGSVDIKLLDRAAGRRVPLRFIKGSEQERTKRGDNDELLYGMLLKFAMFDPTAFTTTPINGANVEGTSEEDDSYDPGEGEEILIDG